MKKRYLLLSLLALTLLIKPQSARAGELLDWAEVETLPSATTATPGYLNSTSTGFRVNLALNESYEPQELGLFIGTCDVPIDQEKYDNGLSYSLSSNTVSLSELKQLLLRCSGKYEGMNEVKIKGIKEEDSQIIYQTTLISDFTDPVGKFSILSGEGSYNVGDEIEIIFKPGLLGEEYQIKALYNDREITFQKSGDSYSGKAVITEGDPDLADFLPLTSISITDAAGNFLNKDEVLIPIGFIVDANSPKLEFTYPDEGQIFNQTSLELLYNASGYDNIEFFLNGEAVESLKFNNLTTVKYVAKIVATDKAGNRTEISRAFGVDVDGPAVLAHPGAAELSEGEQFDLTGETEPFSRVELTIGENIFSSTANDQGYFSFILSDLAAGTYLLSIRTFDLLGNQTYLELGQLTIKARVEAKTDSVVVAQAPSTRDFEYKSSQTSNLSSSKPSAEIAKGGKIISSTDERIKASANYNIWLILAGLVVLSVALSSAGYYGFILINSGGREAANTIVTEDRIAQNITKLVNSKKPETPEPSKDEPGEPDEDESRLRW